MDTSVPPPKALKHRHVRKALLAVGLAVVLVLVLTLMSLGILMGTRPGQRWVLGLVNKELSARLGSEVQIESFELGWNRLTLGRIAVRGCQDDTLLKIHQLDLSWKAINPFRGQIDLSTLTVDQATVVVHPHLIANSSFVENHPIQGSNWDCLWQRIPKSPRRERQRWVLTLKRAFIKQIDWQITGYPTIAGFAPRKTTGLALTQIRTNPSGWRFKCAMKQFTVSNPMPFHASGFIAGWPNGKIMARTIRVDHPEAVLFIPSLVLDSASSIVARNTRVHLTEGHLNRWIPASQPWPALSMNCPSVEWTQGLLSWMDLKADMAGSFTLNSTGQWRPSIHGNSLQSGSDGTDTTLALKWSLHANSQWDQIWQRIQHNLSSGLIPLSPAWSVRSIQAYMPDSQQWTLKGRLHQNTLGFFAEAQGNCGTSNLQLIAHRLAPLSQWAGTAQLNTYLMPGVIGLGPTIAQWSLHKPNHLNLQIKTDSVVWEKESFRNLDVRVNWHNNNLAGQLDLQDSTHQLRFGWNTRFSNGRAVSIAGHGNLNFQFPSIPEICGPLRALGEFNFKDSGQLIQVDLANGALLCQQQSLPIRQASLKLDRKSPGQAIQITINEDSIHTIGLNRSEHVTQALDQVSEFLLGNTAYSGKEIPFHAYFKINNLEDYLPFFFHAPPVQSSNLKGNFQWSMPEPGSDLYWNRGIRLDIGTANWRGWAARKISIRTEYLGNTLLVHCQLDSLNKDEKNIFQKVNYQQIQNRETSTLRLTGTDPSNLKTSLFHGSLKTSDDQWILDIDTLRASVGNQVWASEDGGKIRKYGKIWDLDSVTFVHDSSRLMLNGLISDKPGNQVKLDIHNLSLEQVMAVLGQKNRLLNGVINGQITGDGILNQPNFTGELRIPQIRLDSIVLGDLTIQSSFLPQTNRLVLNAHLDDQSKQPASVTGWLQTNESKIPCDLSVKLNGAPLQLLELVLLPKLDSIRGNANSDIRLTGSLSEPQMRGTLTLNEGRLRIPYLKNSYQITGSVRIEPNQFVFENNEAFDQDHGRVKISGFVKHRNFKEWTYRFQMDSAKNLLVLNEPRLLKGDYYHGLGRINGRSLISGDEKSIQIQVAAEAVKGSRLVIPLDDLNEESAYDFIRFKQHKAESTTTVKNDNEQTVSLSGLELNLGLILPPECEVSLLLDRRFGDQIKGTGNGNLNLTLTREGSLTLTGNYIFEQGHYSFNLVNLVNKNFEIKSGGRIDWNGDPYAGNMQIEAVYKQRASVRNLLGNTLISQTDNRNILPIETYLNLSGPILQPGVKFRLNLPTINNNPNDVLVQQITRINNNEQELNNQVLGLLVSGQFIPSENLNSTNLGLSTSATAFNSVTEMLTTRLSNLLNNSLGGGVNFGINYRGDLGTGILNSGNSPNNALADSNRRDFNVALNTSLFNNRLVIDGNLAMGNSLQVNSRNMAGEINLEYLINPSGTIRAKAFNRPDDGILFNQSQNLNYRQGIGITYNRNFNRWTELLRKTPRQ